MVIGWKGVSVEPGIATLCAFNCPLSCAYMFHGYTVYICTALSLSLAHRTGSPYTTVCMCKKIREKMEPQHLAKSFKNRKNANTPGGSRVRRPPGIKTQGCSRPGGNSQTKNTYSGDTNGWPACGLFYGNICGGNIACLPACPNPTAAAYFFIPVPCCVSICR